MCLMWGATTLLMHWVLSTGWTLALLLGAMATPTDPVLATTILTGPLAERDIPGRLRHLLQAESAANDGLAFLFVMIPIVLLMDKPVASLKSPACFVLFQCTSRAASGRLPLGLQRGHSLFPVRPVLRLRHLHPGVGCRPATPVDRLRLRGRFRPRHNRPVHGHHLSYTQCLWTATANLADVARSPGNHCGAGFAPRANDSSQTR
jgi:hypothetical protein